MSEFSTIVSDDLILFVGSQLRVHCHPIWKIVIAPEGIFDDVEFVLAEVHYLEPTTKVVHKLKKDAEEIGPFTIIRNNLVLTFGQQEALRIPKMDILNRHRLKCVLGLTAKIWTLVGLELKSFQL